MVGISGKSHTPKACMDRHGFEEKKAKADGNCFFHSLYQSLSREFLIKSLRAHPTTKAIISERATNKEIFSCLRQLAFVPERGDNEHAFLNEPTSREAYASSYNVQKLVNNVKTFAVVLVELTNNCVSKEYNPFTVFKPIGICLRPLPFCVLSYDQVSEHFNYYMKKKVTRFTYYHLMTPFRKNGHSLLSLCKDFSEANAAAAGVPP